MALKKEILQDDGIITNYHRILMIQSTINSCTSIVVFSYINQDSREMEDTNSQIYKVAKTYEMDYIENITNEEAYSYLKTLPEFIGAEDVLEEK